MEQNLPNDRSLQDLLIPIKLTIMRYVWYFYLLLFLLKPCLINAQENCKLSINFSTPGITISPMLYGIFFEDINNAADGGLYAEMVSNRSFEESLASWQYTTSSGSRGHWAVETEDLLNSAQTMCLKLMADSIGQDGFVAVQNMGFWGMSIVEGTTYELTFYARCSHEFNGAVTASLISSTGFIHYAEQRIANLTTGWKKYTCTLVANATDQHAYLSLSLNGGGTVWFDVVSLFPPTFKNRSNGLRIDLANKLDDMHPAFMRFPGGCFVEGGIMEQAFRWKETIGPIEERPGHNNFWGYRTSDGMGYHEFLQLCEDIGTEPLYVCNVGMSHNESVSVSALNPWIQDAVNAIEYANGDTSTTWGHQRKLNGHPEPFNMKYIELGNEEWYEPYTSHYNLFYDSVKAHYPDITTISNVNWASLNHIEVYDDHYYSSPEWFAQNSNKYDNTSRSGPKVYVGEYAVTSSGAGNGNLRDAVGEATFMTGMERNSDVVIMSSYAPLFGNLNRRQWNPDAIYYTSSASYGTPSYYSQKMFANNTGNLYIPIKDSFNMDAGNYYNGAVGLGTWATICQYDSVSVQSGDSLIINENFDAGASDWDVYGGTWTVNGGVYEQSSMNTDCRSTIGNITLPAYTYHLKAKKISGSEGFLIIFGYADNNNYYWWNIGGWANTLSAIEHSIGGSKGTITSVSMSVASGRWYDIRIEVNEDSAKCYLDNALIHAIAVGSKHIYSTCSVDSVNHDIFLKVVNFSNDDKTTDIVCNGLPEGLTLEGTMETMTYSTPSSENSINDPYRIVPVTSDFSSAATGFQYTFLQNSINIFHLYPQSSVLHLSDETYSIPENSEKGILVGTVSATGSEEFSYSIIRSTPDGLFEIEDSTGKITVKNSNLLNYETTPSISLAIGARDILNDTLPISRGTCTIILTDVNEQPKLIDNTYYAFANETSGSTIGRIFVSDEDAGQNHLFSVTEQSVANVLTINPSTGELIIDDNTVLQSLASQTVTFTVSVSDNGSPVLTDVKEYILKVNDEPATVGITTTNIIHRLQVFPNPAENELNVLLPEIKRNTIVRMVNYQGIVVFSQKAVSDLIRINTTLLPVGLYCIQLVLEGSITDTKNVVII
jgi:alpha-L-arabinofuranosidase